MEVRILRPETNGVILCLPNVINFEVSYDQASLDPYEFVPRRNGLISFTADISFIEHMDLQQAIGIDSPTYRTLALSHGDHQHAFDRCICVSVNYNFSYTVTFQWQFRGSAFTLDEAPIDYRRTEIGIHTRRAAHREPSQELDWRRFGF